MQAPNVSTRVTEQFINPPNTFMRASLPPKPRRSAMDANNAIKKAPESAKLWNPSLSKAIVFHSAPKIISLQFNKYNQRESDVAH